jgi:hypothetical protein
MRLTKQSSENLKVAERVGFDETDAGVLVFVERGGNRAYLHTADGPACYLSITDARAAVRKHRPNLVAVKPGPRRATASPGR